MKRLTAAATATAATTTDVVEKNPIVGEAYNFRTLSIADRVATPKAPEAKAASALESTVRRENLTVIARL